MATKKKKKRKTRRQLRAAKRRKIFMLVGIILIAVLYASITLNINISASSSNISVGSDVVIYDYTATLFGRDISSSVKVKEDVDPDVVGTYKVVYYVPFTFKKAVAYVVVGDGNPPEITLYGETEIYLSDISDFEEEGYIAVDSYDGDITNWVKVTGKQISDNYYEKTYTVTDSSGNEATAMRKVYIVESDEDEDDEKEEIIIVEPFGEESSEDTDSVTGIVCLTFDDGPSVEITPQILDVLAEKNISATFFVVAFNWSDEKAEIVKRAYEEGHTIGLHGYSHDYATIYQSVDALMDNFYSLEELLQQSIDGYEAKFIRFPGGTSNTISKNYCKGVMTLGSKRATEEGYVYFDWNVDSNDAGSSVASADEIYSNVVNGLVPGRTNVVLMHDAVGHEATLEALERIIDYCLENGYELQAITDDTTQVTHPVAN